MSHPCLSCGACCATFRVSFHWSETDPALDGLTPAALTEVLDHHRVSMRGTWAKQPRCIALDAQIGVRSRCTIHPQRPSVCRDVHASWEHGEPSPQCDRARSAHGLRLLTPQDWLAQHDLEHHDLDQHDLEPHDLEPHDCTQHDCVHPSHAPAATAEA